MSLLTALSIFLGEYPDLHHKMREAVKKIRLEEIRSDSFLTDECVLAMKRMKVRRK